jgi:hypothetical protein
MIKNLLFLLLLVSTTAVSQNSIDWNGEYPIELSDFQSPATQIGGTNLYSIHSSCGIEFAFTMSSVEFLFTKNFNSKVNNVFKRNSSSLVAPDSEIAACLVKFSQYEFDLAELYARKFRKKIMEEKSSFSNANFFKPLYDDIQKELAERDTNAGKETDLGRKPDKLKALHEQVLNEIKALPDFCKECKISKKKS